MSCFNVPSPTSAPFGRNIFLPLSLLILVAVLVVNPDCFPTSVSSTDRTKLIITLWASPPTRNEVDYPVRSRATSLKSSTTCILSLCIISVPYFDQSFVSSLGHNDRAQPALTPTPTPTQCSLEWHNVRIDPLGYDEHLFSIAEISPTDLWTVGDYSLTPQQNVGLIEHGDGHKWDIVQSSQLCDGYRSTAQGGCYLLQ